jgi:predicted nuclease of predicted toxin-antitoxin system
MRIKLDENIATSAGERLAALGHDVHTVLQEGLRGHPDSDVWTAAQTEERFLVTQDLDFSDERQFAAGSHAGVLLVRLPDAEQWRIADYLAAWFSAPDAGTWDRCFVVATPNKVRVRRPGSGSP